MAQASNSLNNYESLSYRSNSLSIHSAAARQVIALAAARTLLLSESGALVLFDAAAGFTVTLPTPVAGAYYDFICTTTITSSSAKVLTNLATEFLLGALWLGNSAATTGEMFAANGTTSRSVNGNGTTTGGIIGDRYRLTALSSTIWYVEGQMVQTGTAATPIATS